MLKRSFILFSLCFGRAVGQELALNELILHKEARESEQAKLEKSNREKLKKEERFYLLEQLKDNSVTQFSSSILHYLVNGNQSDAKNTLLYFDLDHKTSAYLSSNLRFNTNPYASYSNVKFVQESYFSYPNDREGIWEYMDFKEMNFNYQGKIFDFLVGKAFIEGGVAELWSLGGKYNNISLVTSWVPVEVGVNQLRGSVFFLDDKLSFFIIPRNKTNTSVPVGKRWEITSVFPYKTIITESESDKRHEKYSYLMTYRGIFKNFDYFFEMYQGDSQYWVFQKGPKYNHFIKTQTRINDFILGLSFMQENWKVYGESQYQKSVNQLNYDYLRYVVGYKIKASSWPKHIGLDEVETTLEMVEEERISSRSPQTVYSTSELIESFGQGVKLNLKLGVSDRTSFNLLSSYSTKDNGQSYAFTWLYLPTDHSQYRLIFSQFGGPSTSQYGNWKRNGSAFFGHTYTF